jgi:hypothetical protein
MLSCDERLCCCDAHELLERRARAQRAAARERLAARGERNRARFWLFLLLQSFALTVAIGLLNAAAMTY